MKQETILVTGASGHLGGRVIELLLENFSGKLIAGSRKPEKLERLKSKGVELRKVDFDDSLTLTEGFKNVDKLLIISTDALAEPGLRLKQHTAAVLAAKAAGVKHIFYTSLTNSDKSLISFAPDHFGTEVAIKASGLRYTILRNNWYADNLLLATKEILASGKMMTATSGGKVGFISREDCARAAASALLSDNVGNMLIEITGEKAYSYTDVARILSEASGKKIEQVDITLGQLKEGLNQTGLPSFVIDMLVTYEESVAQGIQNVTNQMVKELTGTSPLRLDEFLKKSL